MSTEVEEIESCIRRKDTRTALSLITSAEKTGGPCPRLEVLKAICLQLSDDASLKEVEGALLRAIDLDDQYVDAFVELGWFRLNVLNDTERAAEAFDKARGLLQKLNGEVFRGVLACRNELQPDQDPERLKGELRQSLLSQAEESQEQVS
jgi:hypothetical protein